jgi:hypothetical protein
MRLTWLAIAAALAAVFLPAAAQAQAQALRWSEPEAFRRAMAAAGYEAELFSSDQGSARINARLQGAPGSFNLDFSPCGDEMREDCRMVTFSLPYVLDSVPALKAAWNRSRGLPADRAVSLGQGGYDDPVGIAMEMEVEVPAAGLPRAAFLAKLRSWQAMVEAFQRLMAQP